MSHDYQLALVQLQHLTERIEQDLFAPRKAARQTVPRSYTVRQAQAVHEKSMNPRILFTGFFRLCCGLKFDIHIMILMIP